MSSEKKNDEVGHLGPNHTPDGDQGEFYFCSLLFGMFI